jgi:hypothetical protein
MFEFVAGVLALGLAAQIGFWIVVGLLFPLFWLWMLVDSVLRRDHEYPSASSNEKVLWIVAMLVFQLSCVFYFFMVFRKIERGSVAEPGAVPAVPTPAPAATPAVPTGA